MIFVGETSCPYCGGILRHYDKARRIMRTKRRVTTILKLDRSICTSCKRVHREISDSLIPYKQYEAEIIKGVLEGFITPDTIGFEDYPCELTMTNWIKNTRNLQAPL